MFSKMVTEKPRFYIRLLLTIFLMGTGSVPVPTKYKKMQQIGIPLGFLSYMISFHSMIWAAMNTSNFVVLSESLSLFLILISSFAMISVVILRRRIFISTIEYMDNEPDNCVEILNRNFSKILKKVIEVILFWEVGYFITGVVTSSSEDVKLGTPESLYMPGYIPWAYDTPVMYILSILYQILLFVYPFLINYTTIAVLVGLYTYMDFKYEQLLALVDNLQIHHMIPAYQRKESNDDLIQVIKSYQRWKRLSKKLAVYISDYCSTVIFCAILCSAWSMTIVTHNNIIISVKVKNCCMLSYLFLQLITICSLGEYFSQTDDAIRKSIYNISWYSSDYSNETRGTIIVLMMLTQKPMKVKAYGMIPVDANLSLRMLRIIYSVWNLYRNSYTKKSNSQL